MVDTSEVKDLTVQFDQSSLREFSFKTGGVELISSKNEYTSSVVPQQASQAPAATPVEVAAAAPVTPVQVASDSEETVVDTGIFAEGGEVTNPLVGVAYLAPAPDKPAFILVGDSVKRGQILLIIETMKVMNKIPAQNDDIVTEIMVNNEDAVESGQGLVCTK